MHSLPRISEETFEIRNFGPQAMLVATYWCAGCSCGAQGCGSRKLWSHMLTVRHGLVSRNLSTSKEGAGGRACVAGLPREARKTIHISGRDLSLIHISEPTRPY